MSQQTKAPSLSDTKTLTALGMLAALAFAVMAVCKVIPPIAGFLSFDLKDTVIAIGGFLFGPAAALVLSVLVPLLEMVSPFSDTGPIGMVMNAIATAAFVLPAVAIYRRKHTTAAAVLGLGGGVLSLSVVMVLWNYILTPIFYSMPRSAVTDLMPTIIAFNLVKGLCNSALIMIAYPPVAAGLRKAGLASPSKYAATGGEKPKFNYVPMAVSAVVLVTGVLFLLAMLEII